MAPVEYLICQVTSVARNPQVFICRKCAKYLWNKNHLQSLVTLKDCLVSTLNKCNICIDSTSDNQAITKQYKVLISIIFPWTIHPSTPSPIHLSLIGYEYDMVEGEGNIAHGCTVYMYLLGVPDKFINPTHFHCTGWVSIVKKVLK